MTQSPNHDLAEWRFCIWTPTKQQQKNPVQNPECTQPMAVRLTIVIRIKWECPLANWLNKISRKLQCNATK